MQIKISNYIWILLILLACCTSNNNAGLSNAEKIHKDSLEKIRLDAENEINRPRVANDIILSKVLKFEDYTLENTYPYKDTVREFQIEKIKTKIAEIENFQKTKKTYGVLQNYKNGNGEAKAVKNFVRNAYKRVADTLGTEKYQSIPLYILDELEQPIIYARDGALVDILQSDSSSSMIRIEGVSFQGIWDVPKQYVKILNDSVKFLQVVFVDVTNQNILTLEKQDYCKWTIRSMNPATTGQHLPPYAHETPIGMFVIQEKKPKMFYTKDGGTEIEGYAPWACRFTNGAYTHGVPVNNPQGKIIEYSQTLGTIPRSHMCVRNASSHAKFIYDFVKPMQSLVVVID